MTHPANWGPYKRDLFDQTIRMADITGADICTEPEAAATLYAARNVLADGQTIAVYDLGGGTFDAAVLRKTTTGFDLLGHPEGIEQLGGIDFDEAVFHHVLATLGDQITTLDDTPDLTAGLARLRRDCVDAKEALSADTETVIPVTLPGLTTSIRLIRDELEDMIGPTITDTVAAMRRVLTSAHLQPDDLTAIVLTGGSSRIPLVSQQLGTAFNRPLALDTHPKHDVALGAALHGSTLHPATTPPPPAPVVTPPNTPATTPPAPNTPTTTPPATAGPLPPPAAVAPSAAAAEPPVGRIPPTIPPGEGQVPPSPTPRKRRIMALSLAAALILSAGVAAVLVHGSGSSTAAPQVITVLSSTSPSTLDPTMAYSNDERSILSGLVTRSLTKYVYDPATQAMKLAPDLATTLGTASNNFTTWTFTIRKGVRYSNGDTVTPQDVAFGIERSFVPPTGPNGRNHSRFFFHDGLHYKGPYGSAGPYSGIAVHGDSITLTMDKSFPALPYYASFPAISPMPRSTPAPTGSTIPLAIGPYKIDAFTPGSSLTLSKNPYWSAASDPGRQQVVDGFHFEFNRDPQQVQQALTTDSSHDPALGVDAHTALTYDNATKAELASLDGSATSRVTSGPTLCTSFWFPDTVLIPDVRVRRAIGYAFPYAAVAAAQGQVIRRTEFYGRPVLPPGFPGRIDYNPLPDTQPGQSDAAKARDLLTQAGKVGFDLRFLYASDDPVSRRVKDVIARGLRQAGFTASPVATSSPQLGRETRDLANSDINVRANTRCVDFPTGGAWIQPLFHSDSEFNLSRLSDPAVDARIDTVIGSSFDTQPSGWTALDKSIESNQYAAIVLGYPGLAMLHGSQVDGMHVDNIWGMPTWNTLHVTS